MAKLGDFVNGFLTQDTSEGPVFGLGMIEELSRHGYLMSPGSLYPMLHRMEKLGYLEASEIRNGKSLRMAYQATPHGRRALAAAKAKIRELFWEVVRDGV